MQKNTFNMQKQSKKAKKGQKVPLTFYEVSFKENQPITGNTQKQTDDPISYLHVHDYFEIGYCHRGSGIFSIENKLLSYRAGSVCVVTSREFHLGQSAPGTQSVWTFMYVDLPKLLRPGTAEELEIYDCSGFAGPDFNNIFNMDNAPRISELGRLLTEEFTGQKKRWLTAVRGIIWALLAEMHRLVPDSKDNETDAGDVGDEEKYDECS